MRACENALAQTKSAAPSVERQPLATETIAHLVAAYYASPHFLSLRRITRSSYRGVLDRFCREHGDRSAAGLTRERIATIIGAMADRPGAAVVLLKRLRTLMRFALDMGMIDRDPTHRMRSFALSEFHTWTEDEIATFERYWPIGTKQRLAFALHLYTGQRRSDVHRVRWGQYNGLRIHVTQSKTGERLSNPAHPDLKAILDSTPRAAITILATDFGLPFTVAGYGNWMREAIRKAGLPSRCVLYGLRKAAARRLVEAGCTPRELAAITGHKTLAEVEQYTREVEQKRLARAAIAKQAVNIEWQTLPL